MEARFALTWALIWAVLGTTILLVWVNALTAVLTVIAMIGYAVVYTIYLKHRTPQNLVWGGRCRRRASSAGVGSRHGDGRHRESAALPDHFSLDATAFLAAGDRES